MPIILIIALIFLLYIQTIKYKYIIDDNVRREGYLYENTTNENFPSIEFYSKGPSVWYRLFMISTHALNTLIVYLLWGWLPALLFAVHPMSVWVTAWTTGNYYGTATFFCLTAYYFLATFHTWWSVAIAMAIYAAALNSTIQPVIFPFILMTTGYFTQGLWMMFPLFMFMFGERFQVGYASRHFNMDEIYGKMKFNFRRPLLMVKVMRMYIMQWILPIKCSMFNPIGYETREGASSYTAMHSANKDFWVALGIVLSTFTLGILVDWKATLWVFAFLLLHSQYKIIGQFFAQRYLYILQVGFCIILAKLIAPYPILIAILATLMIYRTLQFIPHFKSMEDFYKGEMIANPNFVASYKNYAGFLIYKGLKTKSDLQYVLYLLNKGLELEPYDWGSWQNLSCIYDRLGLYENALFASEKVVECVKLGNAPKILLEEAEMMVESYKRRLANGDLAKRDIAKEVREYKPHFGKGEQKIYPQSGPAGFNVAEGDGLKITKKDFDVKDKNFKPDLGWRLAV